MIHNNLIRAFSEEDRELLLPHLHPVTLQAGQVLYEPGDEIRYTYFPCGATLVSFVVLLEDSRGVETALVGREGAICGMVSQGHLPAYCRTVVQFPGEALRMELKELERLKFYSLSLHHFFNRYADCMLAQIFQSVACNATHTIEQRMAKWLIAAMERTENAIIPLTQDQLSAILGVGRSYVTRVISGMKKGGVIETMRGKLCIHNQEKLKTLSCGCNDLVREHFNIVLKNVYPQGGIH